MEDMTEPELGELLRGCAKAVNTAISSRIVSQHKPMFALLVFNDPAVAQYISSCQRTEMIQALRECADRLERRQTVPRVEFPASPEHGAGEQPKTEGA
jgi:hypothetical protein